jgi:uncharacterized spore protein YtfJ
MHPNELLKTLTEEVGRLARTETVVGEPIEIGGSTVIPISRVMLGFGGGSGTAVSGTQPKRQEADGGGGGGGVRIEPAAFIVARGDELSILAAPGKRGMVAELFEQVPELIEKLAAAKAAKATAEAAEGGPEEGEPE